MPSINLAAFTKPAYAPKPAEPAKAGWQSLDIATLSDDLQAAYYAYRKAQDAANKSRLEFEAAMKAKIELPDHLRLAFGYKFGKLSVAIVRAERTRKAGLSLADLIRRADKA
jgi:hypothetical protein